MKIVIQTVEREFRGPKKNSIQAYITKDEPGDDEILNAVEFFWVAEEKKWDADRILERIFTSLTSEPVQKLLSKYRIQQLADD